MFSSDLRCSPRVLVLGLAFLAAPAAGLGAADASAAGEATDRARIEGSVHLLARPEADLGRPDPRTWMGNLSIVLRPRAGTEGALESLLAEQQRFGSALFRSWLTPDEFGRRFGIADRDLNGLIGWLQSHGLRVEQPPRGRGWLQLSGTVADLEAAFSTSIRRFATDESEELANAIELSLPSRFARLVASGSTLASFRPRSLLRRVARPAAARDGHADVRRPLYTTPSGDHALAPADFDAIYNVSPLHKRGITGRGVTASLLGISNIDLDDIRRFRSTFGLPARDPRIVLNGPDPGRDPATEAETDFDVELFGAVAPEADIELLITGGAGDALFISSENLIDENLVSFSR